MLINLKSIGFRRNCYEPSYKRELDIVELVSIQVNSKDDYVRRSKFTPSGWR